jgi:hypothetical protein
MTEVTLATKEDIYAMFGEPVEVFEPFAFYNSDGDCVEFYAKGEMYYGDRIDDDVTLYRSEETDEIIGAVIKNIKSLFRKLESSKVPYIEFIIRDDTISIQLLFFALWKDKSQTETATVYQTLTALAINNHVENVKMSC